MSIKVNVSDQESHAGEYEILPSGNYHAVITEVEQKESKSEKNTGKPMLYFTLNIQEGKYAEKTMGVNACCWDGALYTIINMLKALGEYENCGGQRDLDIPTTPEFYIGRDIMVRRGLNRKSLEKARKEEGPDVDPKEYIEVRGFSAYDKDSKEGKAKASAGLLP
jgi:hypothetical protein